MYTLYGALPTRAFRVAWLLEELGQPYDLIPAYPQSAEIRAISPRGKVPVLLDGDLMLSETPAILTHLADKHGGFTAPVGTVERLRQDAMMHRLLDEIEGPIWAASKHTYILPPAARRPAVVDAMRDDFARAYERLAKDLTADFIIGQDMTIVDITLIHLISWARFLGFPTTNEALKDYTKRLRARPAYATLVTRIQAGD